MKYDPNFPKIPAASIALEDVHYLYKMQLKGQKTTIFLQMENEHFPLTTSRNAIGELKGREKPDELVIVSGHVDNWDVGQGAMDDGGGVMISVEALSMLKDMNLIPRRSLQAILWAAEETDLSGIGNYVKQHIDEFGTERYNAAFESDHGTFAPRGLEFAGSEEASCIVREVLRLQQDRLNLTYFERLPSAGPDIEQ